MSPQLRITLLYGFVAVTWVAISDQIVSAALGDRLDLLNAVQLVKGLVFVLVTALGLYILLRREFRRREERERRLVVSEQQFRELFELNPFPIYIIDPVTLRFVDVNQAAVNLYGYEREEFQSLSIADIRPPEESASMADVSAATGRNWESRGIWRHRRKNGDMLSAELTTARIDFAGSSRMITVVRDVTLQQQLQHELEETNRTLQTIFDASPFAIYATDLQNRVTVWSPAAERLTGWKAAEVIGGELPGVPVEAREHADALRARVLAGEKLPPQDIERLHKDGSRLMLRNAAAAIVDHDGAVSGLLGIAGDISAEKEAQRAIGTLAAIVNSSDDAIISGGLDGTIVSWNPGAERLFGYRAEEVIGQHITMLAFLGDPDESSSLLGRIGRGEHVDHFEITGQAKDGRRVDVFVSMFPIGVGNVDSAVAVIARDITELKRSEAQLTYQANLLQNVSDSIIAVDNDWRVTSWNKASEILYGWTADEVIGLPPEEFLRTEFLGISADEVIKTIQEAGQWHGEVIEYRKDGAALHIFNSTALLKDAAGEVIGAVGIERDISWQSELASETAIRMSLQDELERELAMRAVRGRFATMVSHEFRNPLAAIQSSTDLLRLYSERMTEEQRDNHLLQVQKQVQHIVALLNDFLALSRTETIGAQFDPVLVDLPQLLRESADSARVSWPERVIDLDLDPDCPPMSVDRKLIREAILNLVSNALKYSPVDTHVIVRLACTGDEISIEVQDSGIGVPEEEQTRLFETFFRASNVGSTEGTGLGLAIVQRAVEAHGGTITVESAVEVGTTFRIILPRANPAAS